MRRYVLIASLAVFHILTSAAQTLDTDPMVKALKQELQHSFPQLQQQPVPAYFMSLRMADEYKVSIKSAFGAATTSEQHQRYITPQVRLGSMEFDNFKYVNQGTLNPKGRNTQGVCVPVDGKPLAAVHDAIWQETLQRYNIALKNYSEARSKAMTSAENEDKAPCFSPAPVELYYAPELPQSAYTVDKAIWTERLNEVTRVFRDNGTLDSGNASIDFTVIRTWMVTSEGTVVVQNRQTVRIMLNAAIKAVDGMLCPLHQDFFAFTEDQLPSQQQLIDAAKDITTRLLALRNAPVVDPYTGPAILSGPASGVFFHEIFGHRLEGHRLKTGGETFKKKVNERVLPETFNVYCDPTLSRYGNTVLNGHYLYDDEGVKASRVDNVVNGVLRNFLMSRVPLDGFPVSNGHGRTRDGNDPVSRQSNLIVETTKPYTEAELREMLIAEAKRQGKEFGYYFRTVTSGFTLTGEGNSLNSFNVSPVEVYRIFTDGRPDQLVRGVDLIGTPLSMFSNIVAAGNQPSTFTGECGAESGWVPVTATSPMIFVSQVETQRSKAQRQVPALLPQPELKGADGNAADADIILRAMDDEMSRTRSMQFRNLPAPHFVDYRIARTRQTYVVSALGGTVINDRQPVRTIGSVNIVLGDNNMSSEVQVGQAMPLTLASQVSYDDIRRQLWKASDEMYKYSVNSYNSKSNFLQQRPRSEAELAVPELFSAPAVEHIAPSVIEGTAPDFEVALADTLSAVFCQYPELYDTRVTINNVAGDAYRLTSEGVRLRVPIGSVVIEASATVKCHDGAVVTDNWNHVLSVNSPVPATSTLIAELHEFAKSLTAERNAPAVSEYYSGPVMFEDDAVSQTFCESVITPILMASRTVQDGSGKNSQMYGKRIIDTKISISQLGAADTHYAGQPLIGSYAIDADGRAPEQLTVVGNGILRHILCGRHPAVGCKAPTANERFLDNIDKGLHAHAAFGAMRIYASKTRQQQKMRAALAAEARKAGLDYAYIVRAVQGGNLKLYRFDLASGAETLVRAKEVPLAVKTELMHITDISREEKVHNTIVNNNKVSVVAPRSIIVENIEFNFEPQQTEPPFPIAQQTALQ